MSTTIIPSGNLLHSYFFIAHLEIVDLPMKNGGSFQFAFCMFTRPGKSPLITTDKKMMIIINHYEINHY